MPAVVEQLAFAHDVPSAYFWQAPLPSHLPVVPHVDAACIAHAVTGSAVFTLMFAHEPLGMPVRAIEQAWHCGQDAIPQHTLLTQLPEVHWVPEVHPRPVPSFGVHVPALQYALGSQLALVLQPLEHALLLHVPGAQLWVPLPMHAAPFPGHVEALVRVADPEHVAGAHTVPGAYTEQAPEPLHPPESPHVDIAAIAQSLCGSLPMRTAPHTPFWPVVPFAVSEQAWHVMPVHAELQHTPSAQKVLAQSEPVLHFLPFAQRVAQPLTLPPQSTSVSLPSCVVLSQLSIP
jgi:hypothetical protein